MLTGKRSVLSTALLRKRNLPHTCWMNRFQSASEGSDMDVCVAYCFLAPYLMGTFLKMCVLLV